MAQYIDKDALVAEIERRISEIDKYYCDVNCASQRIEECNSFLYFIDTLEVKEIGIDLGDLKGDKGAIHIIDTKKLKVKEVDLDK